MSSPSLDPDPLIAAADSFLARLRRGEAPDLGEYVGRYPELADQIQELFPTQIDLERVQIDLDGLDPGDLVPERIGDFRIVREVGRGGMGLVYYEAVEESSGSGLGKG